MILISSARSRSGAGSGKKGQEVCKGGLLLLALRIIPRKLSFSSLVLFRP